MTRSLVEALCNAVAGLVVSWAVTFAVLPLWGLHPSASASAQIAAFYFAVSTLRGFVIRELFRRAS